MPGPLAGRPNVWGEDVETTRTVRGAFEVAKQLVSAVIRTISTWRTRTSAPPRGATDKNWRLFPDIPTDRRLYDALVRGELAAWRDESLAAIEESGRQELLNWFCLAGAMHQLRTTLAWSEFVETHRFNSNEVSAVYEPWLASGVLAGAR